MKVFLPGGAGLVGLNLIALLREQHPEWQLLVVDKKGPAVEIGRKPLTEVHFLTEDLMEFKGVEWPAEIRACVMFQAEIGTTDSSQFERNNIRSTEVLLAQMQASSIAHLVHVSSSVVNSVCSDLYTQTKRRQEEMVLAGWPQCGCASADVDVWLV